MKLFICSFFFHARSSGLTRGLSRLRARSHSFIFLYKQPKLIFQLILIMSQSRAAFAHSASSFAPRLVVSTQIEIYSTTRDLPLWRDCGWLWHGIGILQLNSYTNIKYVLLNDWYDANNCNSRIKVDEYGFTCEH